MNSCERIKAHGPLVLHEIYMEKNGINWYQGEHQDHFMISCHSMHIFWYCFLAVKQLGEASMAVAREVAPHLAKQGKKLLPKAVCEQKTDGRKSTVDEVIEVAASGVKGSMNV